MRGLDTNILLRHITQDDAVLSPKATRLIRHELTLDDPGYVTLVAICETAWTLKSFYALSRNEVADAIERILQIDVLLVQNAQQVFTAVVATREKRASFEDALIAALGTWAGCASTLTFDRKAQRLPGFTAL